MVVPYYKFTCVTLVQQNILSRKSSASIDAAFIVSFYLLWCNHAGQGNIYGQLSKLLILIIYPKLVCQTIMVMLTQLDSFYSPIILLSHIHMNIFQLTSCAKNKFPNCPVCECHVLLVPVINCHRLSTTLSIKGQSCQRRTYRFVPQY